MADLITSGRIVDLILVVVLLEVVSLTWLARARRPGLRLTRLISLLLPGVCIFLALKAALSDAGWVAIMIFLLLSGVAHAVDVWLRWMELSTKRQADDA